MSDLIKLQAAAASGRPEAQFQLAYALAASNQIDKALRWYERAADAGLVAAQREIGVLRLFGFGMRADPVAGLSALTIAATAGDPPARQLLATHLLLSGTDADLARSADLLCQAADGGLPSAIRSLALVAADCGRTQTAAALFDRAALAGDEPSRLLASELAAVGDRAGCADKFRPTGANLDGPERPLQIQCEDPYIATCDDLFSVLDCRHLIETGRRQLRPAQTIATDGAVSTQTDYRDSSTAEIDPFLEDFWSRILQRRMCRLVGLALEHAEPLTLIHYGIGQQYRPHRDYLPPSALSSGVGLQAGQRGHTVIVYLADVEAGGETEFSELDLVIQPRRGRAVLFRNLDREGRPDPRTLHAGLPVQVGEKWLASLWIRQRRLRTC